jgi:regulator of protease activity HflC (stomatin/prohibitin superfamily)
VLSSQVVAAGQRLAALQLQLRQLSAQQRELGDLIEPEAAALRRQAQAEAEERAEVEGRRDVFILLGCIVGLYGLAATSLAKQVAERKRQMRDRCFLD